jgi:hypothetical protein
LVPSAAPGFFLIIQSKFISSKGSHLGNKVHGALLIIEHVLYILGINIALNGQCFKHAGNGAPEIPYILSAPQNSSYDLEMLDHYCNRRGKDK